MGYVSNLMFYAQCSQYDYIRAMMGVEGLGWGGGDVIEG